ncbi:MAG: DUF2110 family protein [Candidatus Heimdallarchaeota archaeon]|nr:DUF2110 family protein [Candidatus Heimdallarchaeota archaeon]
MKKMKLMTKVYTKKSETFSLLKRNIENDVKDLDVKISSIVFGDDGFVSLTLEGEDELAAYNYLGSLYGKNTDLGELKDGETIKGYICSSGKIGFGVFVDIGIKEPYSVDALLPLFSLREQLVDGKVIPVRKIIKMYGVIDNFPIEITMQKVSIGLKKIEAQLSQKQVETFEKWKEEGLDKLLIFGAYKEEIVSALARTNHSKDIISIENLGWMENVITCKFNTNAKGLIPSLGKILYKARFEIFSPSFIRKTLKEIQ